MLSQDFRAALSAQTKELLAGSKIASNEFRTETSEQGGDVGAAVTAVTADLKEALRRMEANLIAAFRSYDV